MFEEAQKAGTKLVNDEIDTLSTRLILDGAATLVSADFAKLGAMAEEAGYGTIAAAARELGQKLAPPATYPVPELTRMMNTGLMDYKKMLEAPPVFSREAASAASPAVAAPVAAAPVAAAAAAPAAKEHHLADDEDVILEFITESSEHLVTIERQMLLLEKDNTATETLNAVFRGFHTIKGLAGFLEFHAIQSLAHEVETLLDKARTGKLAVSSFVVDVVLESMDVVKQEISAIQDRLAGVTPPPSNVNEALLQRIKQVALGEQPPAGASGSPVAASVAVAIAPTPVSASEGAVAAPAAASAPVASALGAV